MLTTFQSIFNNREQALIIWILVIIILSLASPKTRLGIFSILKALFARKIIVVLFVCWSYVIGIIFVAKEIGIWNNLMLKDSIIWMLAIIVILMKVIPNRRSSVSVSEIFKESIKPIIFVEFVVNLNAFSLGWELILLPLITFIYVSVLYAETKPEYDIVVKFFSFILSVWGLFIMSYSIYKIVVGFNDINKYQEGLNFLLPVWLTISFIPCLYSILLYSRYEEKRVRRKVKQTVYKSN